MSGLAKGSSTPGREKIGKLTMDQVEQIANDKMPDLNTKDLEAAKKIVMGTARSMGIEITN
jgi:large subunit ribosomal protein L11